jgi:hypothetical protein
MLDALPGADQNRILPGKSSLRDRRQCLRRDTDIQGGKERFDADGDKPTINAGGIVAMFSALRRLIPLAAAAE